MPPSDQLDSPLRFRYADGQVVEFPNWPQCRAVVSRGGRRCRNEVLDQGQPGNYFERSSGEPPGWDVDRGDEEAKLRTQLCRVHFEQSGVAMFCEHEARVT